MSRTRGALWEECLNLAYVVGILGGTLGLLIGYGLPYYLVVFKDFGDYLTHGWDDALLAALTIALLALVLFFTVPFAAGVLGLRALSEKLYASQLAWLERWTGDASLIVGERLGAFANALFRHGKPAQAEPLFRRAIEIDARNPWTLLVFKSRAGLARVLKETGRGDEIPALGKGARLVPRICLAAKVVAAPFAVVLLCQCLGYGLTTASLYANRADLVVPSELVLRVSPHWFARQWASPAEMLARWYLRKEDESRRSAVIELAAAKDPEGLGVTHPYTYWDLCLLVDTYVHTGETERAAALLRESLARGGADEPSDGYCWLLRRLARCYSLQDNYVEASALLKRLVAVRERLVPPGDPQMLSEMLLLGDACQRARDFAGAEAACERAVAIAEKAYGADGMGTRESRLVLGHCLQRIGRYREAEDSFQRALDIVAKVDEPGSFRIREIQTWIAECLLDQGRVGDAEQLLKRAMSNVPVKASHQARLSGCCFVMSRVLCAEGKPVEAESFVRRAMSGRCNADYSYNCIPEDIRQLGVCLRMQRRYPEAENWLTEALAMRSATRPPDDVKEALCLADLADLYRDEGRFAQSEPLYRRAGELLEAEHHPYLRKTLADHAELLRRSNRPAEALALEKRANRSAAGKN